VLIRKPGQYAPEQQLDVCRENVQNYIHKLLHLGLPQRALFQAADLVDALNLPLVVQHVFHLARSHINTSPISIRGLGPHDSLRSHGSTSPRTSAVTTKSSPAFASATPLRDSMSELPPPPPPDDCVAGAGSVSDESATNYGAMPPTPVRAPSEPTLAAELPPLVVTPAPPKTPALQIPQAPLEPPAPAAAAGSPTSSGVVSPRRLDAKLNKKVSQNRIMSAANPQLHGGGGRMKASTFIGPPSNFLAAAGAGAALGGGGGGAAAGGADATPVVTPRGEVPAGAEERAELLRDLLPRLLAANRSLKDQVQELEERNADLARENAELAAQLGRLSAASSSASGDGLILGNYNGQMAVKAATPDKLTDALFNPASPGAVAFVTTFLYTYRSWTDALTVIDRLRATFTSIVTAPAATDLVVMDSRRQQVLLVCNVLKKWIETCWYDFEQSPELMERLTALIPLVSEYEKALGGTLDRAMRRAQKRSAEALRFKQRAVQQAAATAAAATAAAAPSTPPAVDASPPAQLTASASTGTLLLPASLASSASGRKVAANHMTPDGVPTVTNSGVVHDKPPPAPILSKKNPREVEEIDTVELARQVTLMMFTTFQRVEPWELLNGAFGKKDKATRAPNVVALTDQFNDFSSWVVYNVVTQMDLKKRAALVRKFIAMAEELRRIGNLNGVFAVVAGLSGAAVHRLKKTWELVTKDKKVNDAWEFQLELTNPQSSFSQYRAAKAASDPPMIPYLGVYLQDLTFIEEGNNDRLENGYINFIKFRMIADILIEIKQFQQKEYNLQPVPAIQEYLLMTRILDEEKLFTLSQQVEARVKK
jgi:hypothetical protein